MPSGGFLIRSRTSLDTRANVRGGKFSMETLPDELLLLYWRYKLVLAGPAVDDAMFYYLFLTEWDSADVSRKFVGDGDVFQTSTKTVFLDSQYLTELFRWNGLV